jgi:uncharacterized protein
MQFAGPPRQFLTLASSAAFVLAISEPILEEIRHVLQQKFRRRKDILQEAMEHLGRFTELVYPTQSIRFIETDPDDNRVLECAVTARSRYIGHRRQRSPASQ